MREIWGRSGEVWGDVARCGGDVGEIWGRCGEDVGRCGGDVGRYGEIWGDRPTVIVSLLAITGTMLTYGCSRFMNSMSAPLRRCAAMK